jgi:hypothetical protein
MATNANRQAIEQTSAFSPKKPTASPGQGGRFFGESGL